VAELVDNHRLAEVTTEIIGPDPRPARLRYAAWLRAGMASRHERRRSWSVLSPSPRVLDSAIEGLEAFAQSTIDVTVEIDEQVDIDTVFVLQQNVLEEVLAGLAG
jgi:hypothetical protein